MHFGLSEEQQQLADVARSFVAELPDGMAMAEQGMAYPAGTWARIAEEQGWPAVVLPEDAGGWGYGWMELVVVFEALGRALVPSPMFATCALATPMLLAVDDRDKALPWLERIAAGETATVMRGDLRPQGDRLVGRAERVVDGDSASLFVVVAGGEVWVVEADAVEATRLELLDTTRPLASTCVDAAVPPEGRLGRARVSWADGVASVLLAAEQAGAAEACLLEAVEYAKVRRQYGRAIGSFQAIQHKCADMFVAAESARSAVWYAGWALDSGADDAALAAHTAAATAGEALFKCAAESVQVHGGIGFTWEHAAHLYLKRAQASLALLAHPRSHRASVADALLGAL